MSDPDAACPLARYPPSFFLAKLQPYERAYKVIQGILFYRRPYVFAAVLAIVELTFLAIGTFNLGFLSIASLAFALYWTGLIVFDQFGADISAICFPPIDEGEAPTSNRIYPLLPFCQRISHISSTAVDAIERAHQSAKTRGIVGMAIGVAIQAIVFFVFAIVGTFWPLWVIVHIVLLAPGIVMHPRVFPAVEPYILKFARAIKCPYCQAQ
jgi:hypothetical protein